MPLVEPFKARYDRGDLFFGLKKHVERLKQRLLAPYEHDYGKARGPFTMMEFSVRKTQCHSDENRAYLEYLQGHANIKYARTIDKPSNPLTWRRKSKSGLAWAVDTGRHVHFALDGIDMTQVVTKTSQGDAPQGKASPDIPLLDKGRAITAAELRWIFRNRAHPAVQRYIQFWIKGQPCFPPWERQPELWERYRPTRTDE